MLLQNTSFSLVHYDRLVQMPMLLYFEQPLIFLNICLISFIISTFTPVNVHYPSFPYENRSIND